MYSRKELKEFCKDKKFLITGHTGFKGAYLCHLLNSFEAKIFGYALKEEKESLFSNLNLRRCLESECISDIRDFDKLYKFVREVNPDYIIHMAAQPLVIDSFKEPRYTYDVNVMGTVNLLESVRLMKKEELENANYKVNLISFLNVTTDKVYENNDYENYAFSENDKLCGYDPYANSKSCSELVTYSYKKSFFDNLDVKVSTVRAGNVIGAGDISTNRIIPDCYKSIKENTDMIIRNPNSIRPYQHVLEAIIVYLNVIIKSGFDKKFQGSYNVGPDIDCLVDTKTIVDLFFKYYDKPSINILYDNKNILEHESKFLRLDNSLIKKTFDYKQVFNIEKSIELTVAGYKTLLENDTKSLINYMDSLLDIYFISMEPATP